MAVLLAPAEGPGRRIGGPGPVCHRPACVCIIMYGGDGQSIDRKKTGSRILDLERVRAGGRQDRAGVTLLIEMRAVLADRRQGDAIHTNLNGAAAVKIA